MYDVSEQYKNWILENDSLNGRNFYLQGTIQAPGETIVITTDDLVAGSVKYKESTTSGDALEVGSVFSSGLNFTLLDEEQNFKEVAFNGSAVTMTIGYQLEDESIEWVPLGKFTVIDSVKAPNKVYIQCLDGMIKFARVRWSPTMVQFPATLTTIIQACCAYADVSLAEQDIFNGDYMIEAAPTDTSITLRDMISYAATIAGSYAQISRDGELVLDWYPTSQEIDYTLTAEHRRSLTIDGVPISVTGLEHRRGNVQYVAGTADYMISIGANPLLQTDIEETLQSVYEKIGSVDYIPFTAAVFGDPARQAGDRVFLIGRDGKEYNSIVTNVDFGFRSNSQIQAVGASAESHDIEGPLSKKIKQDDTDYYTDESLLKHLEDAANRHLSDEQKNGLTGGSQRLSTIHLGLSDQIKQLNTNLYGTGMPKIAAELRRPVSTIITRQYWQEIIVHSIPDVTITSVAVQRTPFGIGRVFVAYISGTDLHVRSAQFIHPVSDMDWEEETIIENCSLCSLDFNGYYQSVSDRIEYYTPGLPWLFYTTTSGQLMAGVLGGPYESLVASGVTAIDAIRGVASALENIDQGLFVFYVIDGTVYYRALINGEWDGQAELNIGPENIVEIKAERVFDWRIVLQVKTSTGELYEIFGRMYNSGWTNIEHLTAHAAMAVDVHEIDYHERKLEEHITSLNLMGVAVLYALSPIMMYAENIVASIYDEEIEEWKDDYGYKVRVHWNENVFGEEANAGSFILVDSNSVVFGSTLVEKINASSYGVGDAQNKYARDLEITFQNFNNAVGEVSLQYVPGTMTGDIVAVTATSVSFTPTGLVPFATDQPVPLSAWNTDEKTIIVEFDKPIVEILSQDGIVVSAEEPYCSPDGELLEKVYGFNSVAHADAMTLFDATFSNGTLADLTLMGDGTLALSDESASVTDDFTSYIDNTHPHVEELWNGNYVVNGFLSGCSWIVSAGTNLRTTEPIPVVAGRFYGFSGGNRCRLRWTDDTEVCVGSSDEGNTGDLRIVQAPVGATFVEYYYTNESSTNASVFEAVWVPRWVNTNVNYLVIPDGTEKSLKVNMLSSTSARRGISWGLDSFDDVDLIGQVSTTHKSATTVSMTTMGIYARGSGNAGLENLYSLIFKSSTTAGDLICLVKYVNGTQSELATLAYTWSVNTKYKLRLQIIGTSLKGKVWTGATEPTEWTLEATDSSLTAGHAGFFGFYSASSAHYYELDYLTNASGSAYVESGNYVSAAITKTAFEKDLRPFASLINAFINEVQKTDVNLLYATSDVLVVPEVWTAIEFGSVLALESLSSYFWLKLELTTTDTTVTPIVSSLYLNESESDPNRIQINLTDAGRLKYPLVEVGGVYSLGNVLIDYDQVLGGLLGQSGSVVESFQLAFDPTDITIMFDPHTDEHLTAEASMAVSTMEVVYQDRKLDEHITAEAQMAIVVTHVGALPL